MYTGLEIAVIGMAGRFPGAAGIDELWENVKKGINSISFFSDEELESAGSSELVDHPDYVRTNGGIIPDKDYFDASFFNYKVKEAEVMAPQFRLLHEFAWTALENAGYDPGTYGGLIGLYAGASTNIKWIAKTLLSGKAGELGFYRVSHLCEIDFLTTTISYKLNLKGPGVTILSACSTSLVAVHMACRALLGGECEMALAGGAALSDDDQYGYVYREGMIFSPDGHCRSFDKHAKGTAAGEGIGIVLLKTLENAKADGDFIYAVIKGSAINNDGDRKAGYTAPSIEGQAHVIGAALQMAEVDPESIGYIEAHGTGTVLGDPIEIEALKHAFNTGKKESCAIGSIKPNIGHLDNAAGIAGFIKTVLMLKHEKIPPSIHFESPNPQIDFANSPFYVNTKLRKWLPEGDTPVRAGVSSFGIGGTNAHVILEKAPERSGSEEPASSKPYKLILLSAKSEKILDRMTANLSKHLAQQPGTNLGDLAYTLQAGRSHFSYRRMLVCSEAEEAAAVLSSPDSKKMRTFMSREGGRRIVFMFPGQGSQYMNMGLELYEKEKVFRREMDRCFDMLKSLPGDDLKCVCYPPPGAAAEKVSQLLKRTANTQPVVFAFEYALTKLLAAWGIKPAAMIGHSLGEYVAAHLSGVFSLKDALELVALRGRSMQQAAPGRMLGVRLPENELIPLLDDELSLAAVNGPAQCVVSGNPGAMDEFEKRLKQKGIVCKYLHTSHAFHSPMMEPILKEFEKKLSEIELHKPRIPFISNVSGGWIKDEEAIDPGYWAMHIRKPVRFADGLRTLLTNDRSVFIETGPGSDLISFLRKNSSKNPPQMMTNTVRSARDDVSDMFYLLERIGQLWLYGVPVDWPAFYAGEKRYRVPLPTYPFDRQRYRIEGNSLDLAGRMFAGQEGRRKQADIGDWFYLFSWKRTFLPVHQGGHLSGPANWLIFKNECALSGKIVETLEKKGHHVVKVSAGADFVKLDSSEYVIDPRRGGHYDALWDDLRSTERIPKNILHLWNLGYDNGQTLSQASVEKVLDSGFYSLMFLLQAMGRKTFKNDVRIAVVTNNMQEVMEKTPICPEKAILSGMVKVIPYEYPGVTCKSIDIDLSGNDVPGAAGFVHSIEEELNDCRGGDSVVAYRGNHRWVQIFEPVKLEKPAVESPRLKEKGVYLITGGLGGIGFVLAEYLAESVKARLILTKNSPFPAREDWQSWLDSHDEEDITAVRIRKMFELEARGAEMLIFNCDVSDKGQMDEVVSKSLARFGTINGIIHCAGVVDYGGIIQRRTREKTEPVFKSKIQGTLVLDSILGDIKPDFFILNSSIASILGTSGEAGYCAANAFLDAYARYKNLKGGVFTVSVNWDTWSETGMAVEGLKKLSKRISAHEVTSVLKNGITSGEGVEVLKRILTIPLPGIAVSTTDLPSRLKEVDELIDKMSARGEPGKDQAASPVLYERPELSMEYVAPGNPAEKLIAGIWQELLGMEKVGIHDNYFELGANSLDIIYVNEKMKNALKRDIPIDVMFEYPTIAALVKYLAGDTENDSIPDEKLQEAAGRMGQTLQAFNMKKDDKK